MAFNFVKEKLAQQSQNALLRQRVCAQSQTARHVVFDGKEYLNFSSNDYLALNQHPLINKALEEGVDKFGLSASASSLITGYNYAHQALEHEICQWLNKQRCILFNSGFSANFGLLQALAKTDTHLILDKLSHASLIDGAISSELNFKRFRHNDYQHLDKILHASKHSNKLVISEGVFSMDGDMADVRALAQVSNKHDGTLYIDDAHSIGVVGEHGQGSNSFCELDITMATFGKALASSGAFIACEEELHDYLINFCRHYIYSTAISPAVAWATKTAINLAQKEKWRRDKISYLSAYFSAKLNKNIKLISTKSAIHAIVIGDERCTIEIANKLKNKGYWLTAIRPPTVPKNGSRLRVTITAAHKEQDINNLATAINEVVT